MTASFKHVGAMPADNETDLVRCAGCHGWADVVSVDEQGRGECCVPVELPERIADEDGRARYAVETRGWRITLRNDGRGFTWSLYVGGQFLRCGYTRGKDVRAAVAAARALLRKTQETAVQP